MAYNFITTGSQVRIFDLETGQCRFVAEKGICTCALDNDNSIRIFYPNGFSVFSLQDSQLNGSPATFLQISDAFSSVGITIGAISEIEKSKNYVFDGFDWQPEPARRDVNIFDSLGNNLDSSQAHLAVFEEPTLSANRKHEYDTFLNSTDVGSLLRSNTYSAFNLYPFFDKRQDIAGEYISGGGAVTFAKAILLSTAGPGSAIKHSYAHFPFLHGKTLNLQFQISNFKSSSNAEKRIGLFTCAGIFGQEDGVFLGTDAMGLYVAASNRQDGTFIKIYQDNWQDSLDGTGPSAATIDFFQVNTVRIEISYDACCARFYISALQNSKQTTEILFAKITRLDNKLISNYAQFRADIQSSGAGVQFFAINSIGIYYSGGENLQGYNTAIDTAATVTTFSSGGVEYPILLFRTQTARRHSAIRIKSFSALCSSNDDFRVRILKFVNTNVVPTFVSLANSALEFATNTAGTINITSAQSVFSAYARQLTSVNIFPQINEWIGSYLGGDGVVYALSITPLSPTSNYFASINFEEF